MKELFDSDGMPQKPANPNSTAHRPTTKPLNGHPYGNEEPANPNPTTNRTPFLLTIENRNEPLTLTKERT